MFSAIFNAIYNEKNNSHWDPEMLASITQYYLSFSNFATLIVANKQLSFFVSTQLFMSDF